jgi:HAD superfamily hydrolase (TIGR01509 family)
VTKSLTIFLDDGGVMNDNSLRGPQWQNYLGEFLPARLGGTPEAWAEANRKIITSEFFDTFLGRTFGRTDVSFTEYERAYAFHWFEGMCKHVGVAVPDKNTCVPLLREASSYVTLRVRAAFPGVVETIEHLYYSGYTLHTASNEASYDLEGYLTGMGVRSCFGNLYGVDLVDILKESPEYYRRVLNDAGVDAARALFVDDSERKLSYAAELGAKTVLVGKSVQNFDATLASLSELPKVLEMLD